MNLLDWFDWLDYLDSLPAGLANRPLESVKMLAQKLDVLKFSRKVVTVAGTNGKGSTIIFLESILLASGLKVGAYISPHVLNYNERIRLNGQDIDEKSLCQAFAAVEKVRGTTTLSYFEFSTLAALVVFKQHDPDILILEVGIGGRFDAVNIVDNDISVITTVALDHTHILGNTKEAIGHEKAGVMRPLKPVVCGKQMPNSIYKGAKELGAKLYCLGEDFSYVEENGYWSWYAGETLFEHLPLPQLPITSAALALMLIKLLSKDFMVAPSAIILGLKNSFLMGRFQKIKFNDKRVILDVAHNFEATNLLALNLIKDKVQGRFLAVMSMLKYKDIVSSLLPLVPLVSWWYVGILSGDRAASAVQLAQSLQQLGVSNFTLFTTVEASFKQAIAECQEKDKIVVFGSFHTVAEVLKIIN